MAKAEKKEKFWTAEVAEKEVSKILNAYPTKFPFTFRDIQVLFRDGKYKEGFTKKLVTVKLIKEPISLITTKKAIVIVLESWWKDVKDSDRTKGIIEGLLTVSSDDAGNLVKRKYDVETFYELLPEDMNKDGETVLDYGQFEKVLPGSAKLVLTSE